MEKRKGKLFYAIAVVIGITFCTIYSEKTKDILSEDEGLVREAYGGGSYEAELLLEIDGREAEEFLVVVPEQRFTEKEEETYLFDAVKEIEDGFVGENASLEMVCEKVHIQSEYQEGKVLAEWEFSNAGLIDGNGMIDESRLETEHELVEAKIMLTCGDSSRIYHFYFDVYKREKSETEQFYEKLNEFITKSGERKGTDVLYLPTELEGHSLVWKEKKSYLPFQIFAIGIFVTALLPFVEKERKKEEKAKREAQLLREYPEMINKMSLLLGAGMTLQGAWKKIVIEYVELQKKNGRKKLVYEEMLITLREIEGGMGEAVSYKAFGERCSVSKYRKFSNYLIQNRKKGSRGLAQLLEKEAEDVFEERKNMAQQYGEEAETKLLFPMLFMLGIVMFIIMVPAILSFQTGI